MTTSAQIEAPERTPRGDSRGAIAAVDELDGYCAEARTTDVEQA